MGLFRVCCGVSGGVDSTVAAMILKRKGYEVVGVFMRNWDIADEQGFCSADEDAARAEDVCRRLAIPFREVSFVKEYWNEVFIPSVQDYERGLTPNPDILCNRQIKFDHFHRHCLEKIGCDAIATGHYARNSFGEDLEYASQNTSPKLLQSIDRVKDQTFFLSQVSQSSLRSTIFPVGGFTKDIVKKFAASNGFEDVARRKESMGICFIGKRKNGFQHFLRQYIDDRPGDIVDIDSNEVLGRHQGIHYFTLGQKVRLGSVSDRLFVVHRDEKTRQLTVCRGKDHPSLFTEHFFAVLPHWISERQPDELRHGNKSLECDFRFQNTQPLTRCAVSFRMTSTGTIGNWEYMDQEALIVSSAEPLRAVTPGQYAAFYKGEECLGSALIDQAGPSLMAMQGSTKAQR